MTYLEKGNFMLLFCRSGREHQGPGRVGSIKTQPLQILTLITPGRHNIVSTSGEQAATLGHNDTAPVVDCRKMRVRLVASALNFSSFHHSSLILFPFLNCCILPFVKKMAPQRPPVEVPFY
jgi:hypothetical protein